MSPLQVSLAAAAASNLKKEVWSGYIYIVYIHVAHDSHVIEIQIHGHILEQQLCAAILS